MKYFILVFFLSFGLSLCESDAQLLFIDETEWLDKEEYIVQYDSKLSIAKEPILKSDTFIYKAMFDNNSIAIEGHYFLNKDAKPLKKGVWKFYYPDGKIQSERNYNEKGVLDKVISVLSPAGDSLSIGYPYQNKDGTYYGHMYRYDLHGELTKVVRYSKGMLQDEFEVDKYPDSRLRQSEIRQFKISDDEYLDELSFEEAVEVLKTDPKPLFVRATYAWNGWSKRMNKVFAEPQIARIIKDNFHLVYLDLGYKKKISFTHNGNEYSFEPAKSTRQYRLHGIVREFFKVNLSSTPSYMLIDTDLNVLATSSGASVTEEKFMHHLRYFIDGHYQVMSYKEYNSDE